jgi:hypothetical protein
MIEMRVLIQFALGVVFLLSSAGKLANVATFTRAIAEYQTRCNDLKLKIERIGSGVSGLWSSCKSKERVG